MHRLRIRHPANYLTETLLLERPSNLLWAIYVCDPLPTTCGQQAQKPSSSSSSNELLTYSGNLHVRLPANYWWTGVPKTKHRT